MHCSIATFLKINIKQGILNDEGVENIIYWIRLLTRKGLKNLTFQFDIPCSIFDIRHSSPSPHPPDS